ncbi:lamin tail domain-containing protein [Conexibacter sp. JD483]|uniref:lamin tail domain-containing protein n=1 Tax=unclassified Conexibacter TaxID=2627773 RepID=UPI00271A6771|nr:MULTISPECIES: lamin tail domain-containing protein [unclassified Conexibacter]MDO8188901.1 lamin tail domain-containing protein [Conexibacter sp. CPCC 205706]MDO8200256.1 lamin tail domain-containing protein [Conexibacter sp. CPCC 205762]MDR9371623.1 lamin tail domain-containing protein [Conexibacter sp. JD483]
MPAHRPTPRRADRRRAWTLAVAATALASLAAGVAAGPAVAAPLTSVDLSQYARVARYDLPDAARVTPPAGSLLASEASSVTYDWDTDTLFVVGDGGTSVVQVSKRGELIDSMTLAAGSSPQGTEFYDTEGIAYLGGGRFALVEERYRQVSRFTYVAGGTLQRSAVQTVKLGTTIGNVGIEGITNDPFSGGFVAVKEKDPLGIFQTGIDFDAGTATNGSPTTVNSTDLFTPSRLGLSDLSDVFSLSNLRGLTGADASRLLVLSQESGKIVNTDRSGNVSSTLTLRGDPGDPLSVADQTHEGVTMDEDGTLYVVDEASGTQAGGSGTSALWVYKPVTTPQVVVSEVSSWSSSNTTYRADWFELTNSGASTVDLTGWKVDDDSNSFAAAIALSGVTSLAPGASAVFVEGTSTTADAFKSAWFGSDVPAGFQIGTYSGSGIGFGSGGDQVNIFDSVGARVTGVAFGAATNGFSFDNAAGFGSTTTPLPTIARLSADGVNGAFTASGEVGSPGRIASPPPPPRVAITEVAPWGSDSQAYRADWFELTNTGTSTVDLTGWKMDDNSHSFAAAVALTGVSTLAPGESAIFLESAAAGTTIPAFKSAWFGSSVPAGLQVGSYTGSGVGLSGSGDEVNVFDASGRRLTGVGFGAATTGTSFDNAAGLGGTTDPLPAITTISADGVNGAFVAGGETGSPGRIANAPALPSVIVSEVSPWSSGNSPYAADWFELTNTGASAVDLTGWKVDDDSNSFAAAVALSGVTSLAAGESAVFIEGTSATADAFKAAWFGASVPAGFQIGSYSGSGIGLSTGGDSVQVFDPSGQRVTGIAVPASTSGKTFDNAAGAGSTTLPLPTVSTLSAVGVNGAFLAGGEIGSPGRIAGGTQPAAPHAAFTVPAFAQQAQGTIGAAQAVTVTNDGTAALTVARVRINDADGLSEGDFLVSNETCTDDPIAPGASCKVWVRFAPGRANATSNATLVLRDDTAAGSSTAALTATSGSLPQGGRGADGSDGRDGADGSNGRDGTDGRDGAQGPAGPTGPAGSNGRDGAQGPAGGDGAQGPAGANGADGRDGAQGPAGPAGAKGEKGDRGAAGRDARVTCKVVTRRGSPRVSCTIVLARARGAKAAVKASTSARLVRNGKTVAKGSLGSLRATKAVKRGGRYTLRAGGLTVAVRLK